MRDCFLSTMNCSICQHFKPKKISRKLWLITYRAGLQFKFLPLVHHSVVKI